MVMFLPREIFSADDAWLPAHTSFHDVIPPATLNKRNDHVHTLTLAGRTCVCGRTNTYLKALLSVHFEDAWGQSYACRDAHAIYLR